MKSGLAGSLEHTVFTKRESGTRQRAVTYSLPRIRPWRTVSCPRTNPEVQGTAAWRAAAWFGSKQPEPQEPPSSNSWELEADDWDNLDEYDEQELINAIYEVTVV